MVRKLTEELQVVAQKELHEKPNDIQDCIQIIKEWIKKEPHLHARTDDQWILSYLRGCKYSLHATKQKIDYYYSLRFIAPEIFQNRDPLSPEMLQFLDKKIALPLAINGKGPQIFLTRLGIPNIEHIPILTITKLALMIYEILLCENDHLIMGQYLIIDMKGVTLSRVVELTMNQLKLIISLQNAYPARIKRMLFLNCPEIATKLAESAFTLISKKLADRISILPDNAPELLCKLMPLAILPKEYGGEACLDELATYWKRKMVDYKEWFLQDACYGTDESKRARIQSTRDNIGVNGSFRKLEFD